jgi:inorganic phosphate transporter, PiT family
MSDLSILPMGLAILGLLLAFAFEAVNGFHDTANAVATVIYTRALRPMQAVVLSGVCNFLGALLASGAVAFGVLALLPMIGTGEAVAMVFAVLISAILWNLGTWYIGLPASSSHALIGALLGVAVTASLKSGQGLTMVPWDKAGNVLLALIISPLFGFCAAGLVYLGLKAALRRPHLFAAPADPTQKPPRKVRAVLIATCSAVSLAHGSNDGQKGMGLVMVVLIGLLPAIFALNPAATVADFQAVRQLAAESAPLLAKANNIEAGQAHNGILMRFSQSHQMQDLVNIPATRQDFRAAAQTLVGHLKQVEKSTALQPEEQAKIRKYRTALQDLILYIPFWVKLTTALMLGLGTMVGWKRIVVTIGERIGKAHLTYGQGAAAEMVAASTIAVADLFGLPVSTTHVLSSGVAGTMVAARSGVQIKTVRNLLLAWVLTLPVCIFLGAGLSAMLLAILF